MQETVTWIITNWWKHFNVLKTLCDIHATFTAERCGVFNFLSEAIQGNMRRKNKLYKYECMLLLQTLLSSLSIVFCYITCSQSYIPTTAANMWNTKTEA